MHIQEEKNALRKRIREAMQHIPDTYFQAAGQAICRRIIASDAYQKAQCIFCFVSYGKEADTHPLLLQALADGKKLGVPLCKGNGQMEIRQIHSLTDLTPGFYHIPEPPANAHTLSPEEIDLALIPCLAATKDGKRLGKGGGYYDRFLAGYTGKAFLLCPEKLMQDHLPMESHDCSIPNVITE